MTRSSASYKVAQVLPLPGLVGGRSRARPVSSTLKAWMRAAEGLPGRFSEAACAEANIDCTAKYDCTQPSGALPAGRRRGRSCSRSRARSLRRHAYKAAVEVYDEIRRHESEVQEGLRAVEEVPLTMRDPVVPASPSRISTQFMATASAKRVDRQEIARSPNLRHAVVETRRRAPGLP